VKIPDMFFELFKQTFDVDFYYLFNKQIVPEYCNHECFIKSEQLKISTVFNYKSVCKNFVLRSILYEALVYF